MIEDPNGLSYSTTYAYDVLGNLTQVNQGVQIRTFIYSSLGRLLSATNPESGPLNYTYFDSGDLQSRSDARGVISNLTYDSMHRVRTKSYSGDGGVTPNVTYSYYDAGSSAPNIGQLQSMSSSAATVNYGNYDVLGRMGFNTQTTSGNAYRFQYAYRLNDSISGIQYPSGKTINYAVDDAGRVIQIDAGAKSYADMTVSNSPFTADGRIAQMKLGNGLWETRIFQTPGSPTLLKLGTTVGANDKLELEYDYSATSNNGNLMTQVIRQPGHTWTQNYTYDSINRLASAAETNGFIRTYGYDRYGNRWVAASNGLTAADPHEPIAGSLFNPANNQLANQSYDAAGNQTSYDPRFLTYDAENRLIGATSPMNGSEYYLYDGDGRRVRKTWTPYGGTAQTTTYVYGPGGQLAAEYVNQIAASTGTSWMFTDLLGSVRAVTGEKPQSGSAPMTECYDYLPFGRILSSNDNGRNTGCYPANPDFALKSIVSSKFTGQIRDAETGLDFFGARYLSAAEGRFLTPDWSSTPQVVPYAEFGNPQSLNLYNYMRNNPLQGRDPDGHCCDWDDVSQFASGVADTTYRPIVQAVSHPIDTGTGVVEAAFHPVNTAVAIKDAVIATSSAALSGDPNAIGKVTGTVVSAVLTAGAAKAASGLVEGTRVSEVASVVHYTGEAGVTGIAESGGVLRAGTYVTLPSEIPVSASSRTIENLLEIQPGRGSRSITFETPRTNLGIPANGPETSNGAVQFQIKEAVKVDISKFKSTNGGR
jgi:RHS repeat-associated protein